MKLRRYVFPILALMGGYVAIAGCGDDETESLSETPDAAPETSTVDTSRPPDTSIADVVPDRGIEQTGQQCKVVADCYQGLDAAALKGETKCLDKVENGYCTHLCNDDNDCCAIPGECRTGLKQVCAPFESTGEKYCFLSCEPEDIEGAQDAGVDGSVVDGGIDDTEYCKTYASGEFGCRSTGGGSGNRKVCLPTGGGGDGGTDGGSDAADAADGDGG